MDGYLKDIRQAVGSMPIILNFAVACVFDGEGRVLLQARDKEQAKWGFPGGALDYGESFAEAAIRECREETGYQVEIGELIGVFDKYFASYPNGDAQTIVVAYVAKVLSGSQAIDGEETHALGWFGPDDMPKLFNQQHQDIYSQLQLSSSKSF